MDESYRVYYREKDVGQVQVIREGLYYHFLCCVKLPVRNYLHLWAICPEHRLDFGLLVPQQGDFVLSVKRPVKYFVGTDYKFYIEDQATSPRVLILEYAPFPYIKDLKRCYFTMVDGKAMACVKIKDTD